MNVDFHNKIFFESYNMQKAMQLFEFIFAFSFHIDTFIIYLFLIFFSYMPYVIHLSYFGSTKIMYFISTKF